MESISTAKRKVQEAGDDQKDGSSSLIVDCALAVGESTGGQEPSSKKARTDSSAEDSAQDTKSISLLLELPFDVFVEIGSRLDTKTLFNLAITNRSLRRTLLSRAARCIWKAGRELMKLPMVPDMTEVQFAAFVFGKYCMNCQRDEEADFFPALRTRLCVACTKRLTLEPWTIADYIRRAAGTRKHLHTISISWYSTVGTASNHYRELYLKSNVLEVNKILLQLQQVVDAYDEKVEAHKKMTTRQRKLAGFPEGPFTDKRPSIVEDYVHEQTMVKRDDAYVSLDAYFAQLHREKWLAEEQKRKEEEQKRKEEEQKRKEEEKRKKAEAAKLAEDKIVKQTRELLLMHNWDAESVEVVPPDQLRQAFRQCFPGSQTFGPVPDADWELKKADYALAVRRVFDASVDRNAGLKVVYRTRQLMMASGWSQTCAEAPKAVFLLKAFRKAASGKQPIDVNDAEWESIKPGYLKILTQRLPGRVQEKPAIEKPQKTAPVPPKPQQVQMSGDTGLVLRTRELLISNAWPIALIESIKTKSLRKAFTFCCPDAAEVASEKISDDLWTANKIQYLATLRQRFNGPSSTTPSIPSTSRSTNARPLPSSLPAKPLPAQGNTILSTPARGFSVQPNMLRTGVHCYQTVAYQPSDRPMRRASGNPFRNALLPFFNQLQTKNSRARLYVFPIFAELDSVRPLWRGTLSGSVEWNTAEPQIVQELARRPPPSLILNTDGYEAIRAIHLAEGISRDSVDRHILNRANSYETSFFERATSLFHRVPGRGISQLVTFFELPRGIDYEQYKPPRMQEALVQVLSNNSLPLDSRARGFVGTDTGMCSQYEAAFRGLRWKYG